MIESRVLRPRLLVAAYWLSGVGFLVAAVAIALTAPARDPGTTAAALLLATAVSLVAFRATRIRVVLDTRGVTVYRIVTTEFVPWAELAAVGVDYGGLRLFRADGEAVTVASMAKPNWATWFHRRAAADDRVDVIRRELSKTARPGT